MPRSLFSESDDVKIAELYSSGKTAQEIADIYICYKQSVLNSLKRSGVERRKDRKYWKKLRGKNNPRWKGGIRYIKGYKHILMPSHHLARKDGYVAEHRIVAERAIGRQLKRSEVVNHINRNITDNREDNLEVYDNNGEHIKMHVRTSFKRNRQGKWR